MDKKTFLVTGASSGLGFEITKQLLGDDKTEERQVYSWDLFPSELSDHEKLSSSVIDLRCNDTTLEEIELLPKKIDQVFLCAGIGFYGNFCDMKEEEVEDILYFNFLRQLEICKMLESRLHCHSRVVFIGSLSGLVPGVEHEVYAASKAALNSLILNWAKEKSSSYEVQVFHPGAMKTNFHQKVGFDKVKKSFEDPKLTAKKVIRANKTLSFSKRAEQLFSYLYRIIPRVIHFILRLVRA